MNEQLEQTVNEILVKSIDAFNQGAAWMAGQIPDVVNQLLQWNFTVSLVWFCITLLIGVPIMVMFAYFAKQELKSKHTDGEAVMEWLFLLAVAFGFTAVAVSRNIDWLQILIAPKLYLLEYAAGLVK